MSTTMSTTSNRLQPGNYMKVTPVRLFLSKYFPNIETEANKLPKHIGEYDVYFNTADLQKVMDKNLFQELECECITHMILTEKC